MMIGQKQERVGETLGKSKENFRALRHETCFTQSQNRQEVLG